ncbi:hypothetical protein HZS_8072 [Henneguya salminicola]|nr:hypothetical protein HZS_8072 [Henneguya salminicola]
MKSEALVGSTFDIITLLENGKDDLYMKNGQLDQTLSTSQDFENNSKNNLKNYMREDNKKNSLVNMQNMEMNLFETTFIPSHISDVPDFERANYQHRLEFVPFSLNSDGYSFYKPFDGFPSIDINSLPSIANNYNFPSVDSQFLYTSFKNDVGIPSNNMECIDGFGVNRNNRERNYSCETYEFPNQINKNQRSNYMNIPSSAVNQRGNSLSSSSNTSLKHSVSPESLLTCYDSTNFTSPSVSAHSYSIHKEMNNNQTNILPLINDNMNKTQEGMHILNISPEKYYSQNIHNEGLMMKMNVGKKKIGNKNKSVNPLQQLSPDPLSNNV